MMNFVIKFDSMKIALISDIHANAEALYSVLKDIETLNIKKIYFLGDLIGYGPEPSECINEIMRRKILCVKGNHDAAVHDDMALNWMNYSAKSVLKKHRALLSERHLEYLENLPETLIKGNILLVHGTPPDSIYEYAAYLDKDELKQAIKSSPVKYSIVGHSHQPFVCEYISKTDEINAHHLKPDLAFSINKNAVKILISCGSVGQPRDGYDKNAKYIVFDTKEDSLLLKSVEYNRAATYKKMLAWAYPSEMLCYYKV